MSFFKKLIGLGNRPEELQDGMLDEVLQEDARPLLLEVYSNT